MNKKLYASFALAVIFVMLTACGGTTDTSSTATPAPTVNLVTAEGHLVPNQSLYLTFLASGHVTEILVAKGEHVTAGQVLARLGDRQQAEAALAAAQLAETGAQQDYDALIRTVDLVRAQTWTAYLDAQKNRVAAQLAWDRLDTTAIQTDIDNAQADVTSYKTDLETAQKDFDKYSNLPTDNATRQTYEDALRTAQTDYDTAVIKLQTLTDQRDRVRATLDLATAVEAEAKRAYENTTDGADVDKLALAQGRLDSAKAQVAAAQLALDNFDLKAPFDGIVEEVNISMDQLVGPTTVAIALADTSTWYVDTSDLGELDVVKLSIGQPVTVTVDALPGKTFTGEVESISGAPTVSGGDVLYKVHIRLDNPDKSMRWGMTVEVTFENAK
jgi:multidrug efflux pump subunit AcrA (membrane-fusion protein)